MDESFQLNHALAFANGMTQGRGLRRTIVKRNTPNLIYFIQAGQFIKIGLTSNAALAKRLSSIQVGCPYEASIIFTQETSRPIEDEKHLHNLFREFHYRGEWFKMNKSTMIAVYWSQSNPMSQV